MSEKLSPPVEELMQKAHLTEEQVRQVISIMQCFNLAQTQKWHANLQKTLLKTRRQEAEDCYKLLKELKKTIIITGCCGYNPASIDVCLRPVKESDKEGSMGKCVNCPGRKLLLDLEAKLLQMITGAKPSVLIGRKDLNGIK
jgi:hypothetical protein